MSSSTDVDLGGSDASVAECGLANDSIFLAVDAKDCDEPGLGKEAGAFELAFGNTDHNERTPPAAVSDVFVAFDTIVPSVLAAWTMLMCS
jgi:hypothetical protein